MIIEKETSRYLVSPAKLIDNSFSRAYDSASDAPVVSPPDLAVTVTSCISMALIFGMCVATAIVKSAAKWYAIGAAFALLAVYIVYKHITKAKAYKDANSAGTKKYDFKKEYESLFPTDFPEKMPASEMAKKIAPLQGKQKKDLYNNAIRDLISALNSKNNPSDILCKNLSLYGDLMTQPKRRYYFTADSGKFVIYDSDFMNPRGEFEIDADDILSFGTYANYPSKIGASGVKVSQDSVIIEIKTGEDDDARIYLEAHSNDYDRIKKMIGAKKER